MIISPNQQIQTQKPRNKEQYKSYIEMYLEQYKPFLIPGFSLQDMAIQTGINVPALSALINKEYGMNFNDFINQYRVAFFKSLVQQPLYHRWTLEAIANKAGFNSRTTFIRAFTKFEECAPSEYLKFVRTNSLVA